MNAPAPGILEFLEYSLDAANARLRRGPDVVPLRPKALAVLHYLAERPGRLVTKDELLGAVWADTAVSDWVLTTAVKELREVLGEDARRPRIIETVHRRGYRFVAAVRAGASAPENVATAPEDHRAMEVGLGRSIVGRRAELEMLDGCWRRALAGERQVVFVAGEAGMGKTALVDEFLRRLDPRTCLVAGGQCLEQHGAGEPYLPVVEALGRVCSGPGGAPLTDLLRRHAPAWLVQIPGVLEPAECEALEKRLGGTTSARMLREMAALVAALETPLVLVLEDLHWSDHATLDVVSTVARRRDRSHLLLIGTYRPVEVALHEHPIRTVHHDLRARAFCSDLWLEPLTEPSVAEYLGARWPGATAVAALARVVRDHTDGNPLFLVNIADYLEANGGVVQVEGSWRLQRAATELAVDIPQGLRQLIATQIDRLDEGQRRVLEVGSLAGRTFSAALVAAALAADVVDVEARLAELSDSALMIRTAGASEWPDGAVAGAYRFDHFLYQSVLRERVPPARRRQLHERIAARLELAYRDQLAEVSAELAFHFEASGEAERAVQYLEEAAARAMRVGANREAVTLLEHALAIVEPLPPTPERKLRVIRLCMTLGPALMPALGYGSPKIEQAYQRARQLSEESNDPVQLLQALIALALMYLPQARLDRAQDTAREVERLLSAMPIPPFVFAGSLVMGMVKYHAGELREARELLERAVALDDVPLPPLSMDLHAVALSYLTMVLMHQGYPDRARSVLERARRTAARGWLFDRGLVAQFGCFVQAMLRDFAGLAALLAETEALEEFPAVAAIARFSRGRVLSARGEHALALQMMREALDAYRASGQNVALSTLLAMFAEAHAASGDLAAALICVAEAWAVIESVGEIRYVAELHRLEGAFHAARGERSVAERSFHQAITIAREQGARWWELRATTSLVRLALEGGAQKAKQRAHCHELAALIATFGEGLDTTDLQEAQQLVERGRS